MDTNSEPKDWKDSKVLPGGGDLAGRALLEVRFRLQAERAECEVPQVSGDNFGVLTYEHCGSTTFGPVV